MSKLSLSWLLALLLGTASAGCGTHSRTTASDPFIESTTKYPVVRLVVENDKSKAAPFIDSLTGAISSELLSRKIFRRVLSGKQAGQPSMLINVRVKYFKKGKGGFRDAVWALAVKLIELGSGKVIGQFEVRAVSSHSGASSSKTAAATAAAAKNLADYLQGS